MFRAIVKRINQVRRLVMVGKFVQYMAMGLTIAVALVTLVEKISSYLPSEREVENG